MDHLGLQLVGETNDLDGIELTLVDADTASLAYGLGDDGFASLAEGYALGDSSPHEGTEVDAFLVAFLVLASVVKNRGYPHIATNKEVLYKHSHDRYGTVPFVRILVWRMLRPEGRNLQSYIVAGYRWVSEV